jgi:Uma2 family endonuclease
MAQTAVVNSHEAQAAPPKMTYEEFLSWADEDTRAEWVNGEVELLSPLSMRHLLIGSFLHHLIGLYVEARGLGQVLLDGAQMKLGPGLAGREPDMLFVANDHLSRVKDTYIDGPADLVIEIVSPESRMRDRGVKYYEYEQGGVCEYWLIDPVREQAEFHHLGQDGIYRLAALGEDGLYRSSVLPGFWLDPTWLWQDPLPPALGILKRLGVLDAFH